MKFKPFDVSGSDESYILKLHMENLRKQGIAFQKLHNQNSTTWAFFKVKYNNQFVDLKHNPIMHCIVYHSEMIDHKNYDLTH